MKEYIITRDSGIITQLGRYKSLKEVSTLHIFKSCPDLLKQVSAVKADPKEPKSYNRWRVIYRNNCLASVDYTAYYTAKELRSCFTHSLRHSILKLRLVSKREYHANDGEF
jgi:hypothetical protein